MIRRSPESEAPAVASPPIGGEKEGPSHLRRRDGQAARASYWRHLAWMSDLRGVHGVNRKNEKYFLLPALWAFFAFGARMAR